MLLIPCIVLPLYKAFIRPNLEYTIYASSPILSRGSQALGCVQELVVKFVKMLRHVLFEVALQHLRIVALVRREIHGDFICMYKIVNGLFSVQWNAGFAAPLALGFAIMHSRFTNSGVEAVAANMRSEIKWSCKEEIVNVPSVETSKTLLKAR